MHAVALPLTADGFIVLDVRVNISANNHLSFIYREICAATTVQETLHAKRGRAPMCGSVLPMFFPKFVALFFG